MLVYIHSTLIK